MTTERERLFIEVRAAAVHEDVHHPAYYHQWLAAMGDDVDPRYPPLTMTKCEEIVRQYHPYGMEPAPGSELWGRMFVALQREPFPDDYHAFAMSEEEAAMLTEWAEGADPHSLPLWSGTLEAIRGETRPADLADRLAAERDEQIRRGAPRVADRYERARLAAVEAGT